MADLLQGIGTGRLVSVEEDPEAASLLGDHATGETSLSVSSGGRFYPTGTCRIGGTDYAYTRDDDTLTITPGLAADAEDGTAVESLDAAGNPEAGRFADVDLDGDGNTVAALIPTGERGYYPVGIALAGSLVTLETDKGYGYRTLGRPVDLPQLDQDTIRAPSFAIALAADEATADGVDHILTNWEGADGTTDAPAAGDNTGGLAKGWYRARAGEFRYST